ncbi:pseudouridine synthase [Grosmannia clavigera kw1407]|uniref:Pseudouridine synthase n=1 Tax=Grosmannia clavigera (strain kw1407 / UAMH 11150) TaxID=655863 RepID=F0XUC0_GROCL|nr:pseudouridine synthase [Grosmannia clavigera kw1407]EFW98611.1 pseudouridine synthase [Grosmannia clavigera kw1407]
MANLTGTPSGNHLPGVRTNSEKKLGVLHYTSCIDFGWIGDIRKRYTDFIVHEVRKDGTVVYLSDVVEMDPEKLRAEPEKTERVALIEHKHVPESKTEEPEAAEISKEDADALSILLGAEAAKELQEMYAAIVAGGVDRNAKVTFAVSSDRSQRGHIHQEIRRIFFGRFETQADPNSGSISAQPVSGRGKPRVPRRNLNGPNWRENRDSRDSRDNQGRNAGGPNPPRKGPYLHFTLYKENKDTMEAINHLARMMKMKSVNFGFAGTKDRRAATTQRVSVKYHGHVDPAWLNSRNNNIKVGDFSYHKAPIQLGQHGGNEFTIAIKNVELARGKNCSLSHRLRMAESCVQAALDHIQQNGFINYFGLQRFGTHAIGTQEVGLKILSGDFESACDYILHVDPALMARLNDPDVELAFQRDEISRARAISLFKTNGDTGPALQTLPKRYGAESAILQHLSRSLASRRDFCGALLKITRGLRNLYIHAYQSLVWNWIVSRRWSKFGNTVIAGDLVLVESEVNPARYRSGMDMSEDLNQDEEQFYQEARVLTAEDAASGKYTIFDIVLPVPGYDVLYPENEIGEFYVEFMGRPENGGLNPYRMRRPQKEFSLSGYYRKIMARFSTVPKFFVRPYMDDSEQMHPTDLDEIRLRKAGEGQKQAGSLAPVAESTSTSDNTETGDIADSTTIQDETSRRRRLTPDRPQDPPEKRVNDAWIETKLDGSSKRVKLEVAQAVDENVAPAGEPVSTKPIVSTSEPLVDLPMGDSKANETDVATGVLCNDKALPTMEDVSRLFDDQTEQQGNFSMGPLTTPRIGSSDMPSLAGLTPVQSIKNVFKDVPVGGDISKALNLTAAWRSGLPTLEDVEEMKIAVVLNFRLNSSNYATICMREMMSTAFNVAPETNSSGSGFGQLLGHGGHIHHESVGHTTSVSH